ncbi:hypothetical protein Tco_1447798 [Tanacetum coccineum]
MNQNRRNINPVVAKQVALDNSLVPSEKILKIVKCNARIEFSKPQREEKYQVTLDALKLSPCYPAFMITAEVPKVYMHQFWNTIHKIKDTYAYRFKLDKKKFRVDSEVFHDILQIFPRLHNQAIVEPPLEEELVTFIQKLGASLGRQHDLIDSGNHELKSSRKEHMPYPQFTKVIINYFFSKDKTISMKNMINLHTIRDDSLLGTLKFISKTQDCHQYGALILDDMINQDIKDSKAYMSYYDFATRKATPKKARKEKPKQAKNPAKKYTTVPTTGVTIRDTPSKSVSKKKTSAKVDRGKGMDLLSDVALLEAAQLKKTLNDDDYNNDDTDEVTKDDDEDHVESDADDDKEASDSEKTDSDEDENLNLN